jgi:hypothetical protein
MKHSNSFSFDLAFGEEAEDWARSLFTGSFKVEVKSDRMAHETGNLYVEVYSRGKKSGLATSTADYWLFKIEGGVSFFIETEELKKRVRENWNGRYVLGGDEDTSKGVLIAINKLYGK